MNPGATLGESCANWTSGASNRSGITGSNNYSNAASFFANTSGCDAQDVHLYCLEE
jgi:hypothetical protein